ncbi:MAG: MGMT family protein [Oscillospiraceae bacterium]|nr:MGMT family protein [Oscillospiraceae bacterium]
MTAFELIYEQVKRIPRGKVATYGQIAMLAGNPRWSRAVGYALHANPDPENIPCYRVLNRFGGLAPAFAFGGAEQQAKLLRAEGIEVRDDSTVDLEKYLWDGL